MKKIIPLLLCSAVYMNIVAQNRSAISDSNNLFAFNLYNKLKLDTSKNLFFSPFSISTALAMTYAGARKETEKQISQTLHFSMDQDAFHKEYKTYLEMIEGDTSKELVLGIANSLWIANSLKLLAPFVDITTKDYSSEAKNVDFFKSEETRKEINTWVEGKTYDKIKDLIQPHIIDGSTRLVLVNAIYFKGKWKVKFSKDSTRKQEFFGTESAPGQADFMHNTTRYKYYSDSLLQVIELPYSSDKTSMLVLLPQKRNGIKTMETALDYSYYSKVIASLRSQKVKLALPKFKTTVSFELSKTLSSMGMPDAFLIADFSGISKEGLNITNVIHKAFIDVDEEGTEAAAATAVSMKMSMAVRPPKTIVFNANHPFIFVIRDNGTGSILFMGKINDPKEE